ncbi:MAG: hypothetical protein AMJ53_06615, partial [Gammaproteobacteria bacterium SG8_11]
MSIHYIIKSNIQLIILVAIFGALAACNVEDTKEEASTTTLSFSGSVGDGPITQAQISVTDANGTVVAKTVSDITANYSVSISGDISYPLLVTATGGTDVVTSAKPDFVLLSVAMNSTLKTININPFSTLIVKTAQAMHGGLTPLNLSVANKYILEKLNFGLDPTLVPNPITTTIDAANVAVVIKASEALGETIRRIRSALLIGGMDLTEDQIIDIIAEDMIDSVLDGRGPSDNIRIAATAHIVSAQVLVEALANQLYVSGADATTRMNTAINLSMPSANTTTADVLITEGMLTQTRLAVAATQALNSSSNLVA